MLALPAALLAGNAPAVAAPAAVTAIEVVPMLCDDREDRIDRCAVRSWRSCPARPEPVSSKRAGAALRRYRRISRAVQRGNFVEPSEQILIKSIVAGPEAIYETPSLPRPMK